MQPEDFPTKNSYTCQFKTPNIREKYKTSTSFLKDAFTGVCSLLMTIFSKLFYCDDLSFYPGYKKYKETNIY